MLYKLPCASIGALSNILTCFDTMNQLVRLDIVPSGFHLRSVDHDETTVLLYTTPIESIDGQYTENSTIYVKCEQLLQDIEGIHGMCTLTSARIPQLHGLYVIQPDMPVSGPP